MRIDIKELKATVQVICIQGCTLQDDIIAVGGEGKNICLYDIATKIEMGQWAAHASRVKCLCTIPGMATEELWLVSASSDGVIKVWSLEVSGLMIPMFYSKTVDKYFS